jgi:GTP pyrophosphokinase
MAARPERVIEVAWGCPRLPRQRRSTRWTWRWKPPTARACCATSPTCSREKTNVIGVQTQSVKGVAWMTFTVEVADSGRLNKVLGIVAGVAGVRSARRR